VVSNTDKAFGQQPYNSNISECCSVCNSKEFSFRFEEKRGLQYHVQEGLGLIPVPCILKMKLVPPSLPQSSYVSSSYKEVFKMLNFYSELIVRKYLIVCLYIGCYPILFLRKRKHYERR
jgi:hypothetical protein